MTDRSIIANVRSIAEQSGGKAQRRAAKVGRQLVKVARAEEGGSTQLRAVDSPVGLAERARAELARMNDEKLFSDAQLDKLGIVHPRTKNRALVDALRQLRTKLYSLRPDGNFSVLVSSVVPEGGGSFVALNLAATIAFDKAKSSVLVDANLLDPFVHHLLRMIGRNQAHGLLEYLEHPELGIENIVSPSGIPRMRAIPIGQNGEISAEHFTSARYRQLMIDIQQRYDNRFVIVDGPPMSSSADARILSDICDFTVLVVPYGGVTTGTLDAVVDEIDESRLAGIVLNNQPA